MTKWVAEFDIPDGHLIGAAYAKTCPNDNKIREEEDYKTVYAMTQRKTDYLRKNLKESNYQHIKRMNREELAAFLYRVELGDVDFSVTFCDLCQKNHDGECDREECVKEWLGFDSKDHPQGLDYWEKDNG